MTVSNIPNALFFFSFQADMINHDFRPPVKNPAFLRSGSDFINILQNHNIIQRRYINFISNSHI